MIKESVTLRNDKGFHFRPANVFSAAMSKYECDVRVAYGDKNANGKSITELLAADFEPGDNLDIECDGVDERNAVSEAANLIMTGIGERVPAIC